MLACGSVRAAEFLFGVGSPVGEDGALEVGEEGGISLGFGEGSVGEVDEVLGGMI
jgi:hypothetical protein